MAERKIFAGPKVRRIRNALALTQTAMAEALEISPSYLNLIERNQRPLTVQLLLKLSSVYRIDLEELQGETAGSLAQLKEVFADPLLSGELPGDQELVEVADAAPNAAGGMIKLYRAYREQAARLSDLTALMAGEGRAPVAPGRLPLDEVREVLERRPAYFADIEAAAESFANGLAAGGSLKDWLKNERGVATRILPVHVMPDLRRRFDRHSMRLFLSERLSGADQAQEIAIEVARLALRSQIEAALEELPLASDEARRIARFELTRSAALALLMPYEAFLLAAQNSRYDIDLVRARFAVSFSQAASRLVMLQRPGAAGIPFFLMESDAAGHVIRKAGAQGFPQARFGGNCPKLNIHAAFLEPGRVLVETVAMPDGSAFLTIARTLEGPVVAFGERARRRALLIGCDAALRDSLVYGGSDALPVAVGPACRLCERRGCLSRAEPPLTRPLALDETSAGLGSFDFQ
ncbi:XRE family transcriptional regulator [Rhizobium viscosum]|uniref:Transcriptional regulator/transcriptional regulator with XRE-family HTH domain n=1 Tax=Rhizobium viscosum TaxID=1673 RepID=A0ABR9ILE4_RHIVS|nr:XRE family transcriptional regulator [Rhizobium viscosum]MBE1504003.1 putative transcriptional regulator/transcriptional regulator with XRE-family HTH domain [Rhizobium viscosum]